MNVTLSHDGRRAATGSLEAGRLTIRFDPTRRGGNAPDRRHELEPGVAARWRLVVTSMRKGDFDVYVKDVGGTGTETAFLSGPDDTDPVAWLRDGRLVFQGSEPDGAYPLKLFDPRQPNQITRLTEQHVENGGAVSPVERWLAYQSAATGRTLIYVRALAGNAPGVVLSRNTGEFRLHAQGRELAFVRSDSSSWRRGANGADASSWAERTVTRWRRIGMDLRLAVDTTPDGRFPGAHRTQASPPVWIASWLDGTAKWLDWDEGPR